jgi:succinate dehydrogenase / fumarate reductase cytochrome b subunit
MSRASRPPVFLDLMRIRFPVGAVASILHRASGLLLVVSTPLLLYTLDRTLRGPESFAAVARLWGHWPMRLLGVVLAWALTHHALAGLRLLLTDLGYGLRLPVARITAWTVNLAAAAVLLLAAGLALR